MAFIETVAATGQRLAESPGIVSLIVVASTLVTYLFWPSDSSHAPALPDLLPYVSNTYQYMTDMRTFLTRATEALRLKQLVSFHLGPMKVYLVTGAQNVQALFRTSANISSDKFMIIVWENIWGFSKADLAKFTNDKSGRLPNPTPGTEGTPEKERYWANLHHVFHDNLARVSETNKLAAMYQKLFGERLEAFPLGESSEVRILEFLRKDMLETAIISMFGPRVVELNPGFLDLFWQFDEIAASLAWGLPRWVNGEAWKKRDRFLGAHEKYLQTGYSAFDWKSPDADADWEPIFGSRLSRELAKYAIDHGLGPGTSSGLVASIVFGLNANTIPITIWGIMELAKDPELFQAVREEVLTACKTGSEGGRPIINTQALLSLPLLQSIYTEILRLHVSINITREILEPMMLSGHHLEKGALLQAPSEIAQYDNEVWGVDGHPASEFWAARHVKQADLSHGGANGSPQFTVAGRSNNFFPYGGGVSICPGRFFAKQEIMWTLAMFVLRFDVESFEWTTLDGSPSDRPPKNDVRWAGGASEPPDREIKIRWKRRW